MRSIDFIEMRRRLGRTQAQMAGLLDISLKAVQSFEQGWRNIPTHIERQLLFLLCLQDSATVDFGPCWESRDCPTEVRERCLAWEVHAGRFCWFVTGTLCEGTNLGSWEEKMQLCRRCEVFRSTVPSAAARPETRP